jgi:uncharacterized protein (TIGR02118 family)
VICLTVLYPNADDATFDMDYYIASHMPMLAAALGEGCKGWGAARVTTDKHVAMGWAMIDSIETYKAAMGEHGAAIRSDVANYTNQQPEVILGEVMHGD